MLPAVDAVSAGGVFGFVIENGDQKIFKKSDAENGKIPVSLVPQRFAGVRKLKNRFR